MRLHTKTVAQKYDMYDPRTWPLVKRVVSTDNGMDYSKSKAPPEYMAYDRALSKVFNESRPFRGLRSNSPRRKKGMTNLFCCYPFNYNRHGELRARPHIPSDELEEWMKHMGRSIPTPTEEAHTKIVDSDDNVNDTTPVEVSPQAAIHEIMRILDDTGTVSTSRVTELKDDLDKSRKEVSEANERANEAEKRTAKTAEDYQAAVKKYSKQVCALLDEHKQKSDKLILQKETNYANLKSVLELTKAKYDAAVEQEKKLLKEGEVAEATINRYIKRRDEDSSKYRHEFRRLKTEAEQSSRDVSTARQQTVAAQQDLLKILEVLKKKEQGQVAQKRKELEDIVAEGVRKRMKLEK